MHSRTFPLLLPFLLLLPTAVIAIPFPTSLTTALRRPDPTDKGLTFDFCNRSSDCNTTLTCVVFPSFSEACPEQSGSECVCRPDQWRFCQSTEQCPDKEVCAYTPYVFFSLCVSKKIVDVVTAFEPVTKPPPPPDGSLTLDTCTEASQCKAERRCVYAYDESFDDCKGQSACFCIPDKFQPCFYNQDCDHGEVCADGPASYLPMCYSPEVEKTHPAVVQISVPDDTDGNTLDPCRIDSDCKADRICLDTDTKPCTSGKGACACWFRGRNAQSCGPDKPCEDGEVCTLANLIYQGSFCASKDIVDAFKSLNHVPYNTTVVDPESEIPLPTPTPVVDNNPIRPKPPSPSAGQADESVPPSGEGDNAQSDGDEQEDSSKPEAEADPEPDEDDTSSAENGDQPGGDDLPEASSDSAGEPQGDDNTTPDPSPAGSPSSTPPASPTPEPVCVDARALNHLPSNDLIYSTHAIATVLCDDSGSCATGGHIVVWNGKAMMMSRYCKEVSCKRRIMRVNSPRYRRRRRVPSRTEGLEYTAFAARYGTGLEEAAIAAAVRVGL